MPSATQKFLYARDDYAQSANSLFHFMKEPEFLKAILVHRAIVPRYCIETIDYLNISKGEHRFIDVAILQKCFCDIPFHKLADTFPISGTGEAYESLSPEEKAELEKSNTHFAYYGEYAISFSKRWGEQKGLQPVHYVNKDTQYVKDFSSLFEIAFSSEEFPDAYSQDILARLAYIKPIRGVMKRTVPRQNSPAITVDVYKNFHDEREWRFVPDREILSSSKLDCIIANPNIITSQNCNRINKVLEGEHYRKLWLTFSYDDIRYILVPNIAARKEIIKAIQQLPESNFEASEDILIQKSILSSKILVLEEIRRDW